MNTDTPPALKRKRSDSTDVNSTYPLKRGEPWFDDGNIVLQAESTQFKVHRGVLSATSDIFRDMLTFPQPLVSEMLVEGCAVVSLPDKAEDWAHVLKALYSRGYYSAVNKSFPFCVVAAFLRLGKKYDLKQLYHEAFARLHHHFPSQLEHWDININYDLISDQDGLDFDTINLLREIDIPLLLPAAFFLVCEDACIGVDDILGGIRRDDGSLATLSTEDARSILRGKQTLISRQARATFIWLDEREEAKMFANCANPRKCPAVRKDIFYSMWHPSSSCIALAEWNVKWEARLCEECVLQSKTKHNEGRQRIWRELPSIFGLPGWNELAKV